MDHSGRFVMSAIALVGSLTIVLRPATLEHLILPLVSLAAGTLLGWGRFHMFPSGFAALSPIEGGVVASDRLRQLSRSRAVSQFGITVTVPRPVRVSQTDYVLSHSAW
jgi:hypothetical protein